MDLRVFTLSREMGALHFALLTAIDLISALLVVQKMI